MKTSVRKCTAADLKELQDISRATFKEAFGDQNTPEQMEAYLEGAFNLTQLEKEMAHPHSRFYFAEADGTVAGYLKVNIESAQTESIGEDSLEVERIYLKNMFHKRGIGKLLMDQAELLAGELGKERIWLGVWEHNTNAIAFYERKGFVRTGSHVFFLGDDEQTDWIMAKNLG